jgi:hypothetical protein
MWHNELTQRMIGHSVLKIKGKIKVISLHNLFLPHMCEHYNTSKHNDDTTQHSPENTSFIHCWPCIVVLVYQYSETNVMYFWFILLRIKGFYMFRAFTDHPQEAMHKRHLVYCLRFMSAGCTNIEVDFNPGAANWHNTHAIYKIPPPENEQVTLETCRGP